MKPGLNKATIRVFEPSELAENERDRLFGALERFANLGDGLEDYAAFGRQNPDFFPVEMMDQAQVSFTPLAPPSVQGRVLTKEGERRIWTKVVAWEQVCHELVLLCRNQLQAAWRLPRPGPHDLSTGEVFEILLGLQTDYEYADREEALRPVLAKYPSIQITASPIMADWKTGSFDYSPRNDFQRAVYILFREGWRAKTCVRCSRRYIADKPVQAYCSTRCSGEAKRERNLTWWNAHGNKWRKSRKTVRRIKKRKSTRGGR